MEERPKEDDYQYSNGEWKNEYSYIESLEKYIDQLEAENKELKEKIKKLKDEK